MRRSIPFFALAALPFLLIAAFVIWAQQPANVGLRPELLTIAQDHFASPGAAIGPEAHLQNDPRSAELYGIPAASHGFWNDGTSVLLLGGGDKPGTAILDAFESRLDPVSRKQTAAGPKVQSRSFRQGDGVTGQAYAADAFAVVLMGPNPAAVIAHADALPAFPKMPANAAMQLLTDLSPITAGILAVVAFIYSLTLFALWRNMR